MFHQGAAEISAANREDLLEHHRLCVSPLHHCFPLFATRKLRVESDTRPPTARIFCNITDCAPHPHTITTTDNVSQP